LSPLQPPPEAIAKLLAVKLEPSIQVLTADVCWTHVPIADVCWTHVLTADVCWTHVLTADVCWTHVLTDDVCWTHVLRGDSEAAGGAPRAVRSGGPHTSSWPGTNPGTGTALCPYGTAYRRALRTTRTRLRTRLTEAIAKLLAFRWPPHPVTTKVTTQQ